MSNRKIVQFEIDRDANAVIALADGRLWVLGREADAWFALPEIPGDEADPLPAPKASAVEIVETKMAGCDLGQPDPTDTAILWTNGAPIVLGKNESQRDVRLNPSPRYTITAEGQIPAEMIGKQDEIYLLGLPGCDGFQVFARLANRWLCVGADWPVRWIRDLSMKAGQPLESGRDGKPITDDYEEWCGMRWKRLDKDGRFAFSITVPWDGIGRSFLQIGEMNPPRKDTKLPIGVRFDRIEVRG